MDLMEKHNGGHFLETSSSNKVKLFHDTQAGVRLCNTVFPIINYKFYRFFLPQQEIIPLPLIGRPSLTHIFKWSHITGIASIRFHLLFSGSWRSQAKMYLKERDQINSILYWTSSIDVQYDGHKRDY